MPCRPGRQTPAVIPAREKASLRDLEHGEKREPQMNADERGYGRTARRLQREREPQMNATVTARKPQMNADRRR